MTKIIELANKNDKKSYYKVSLYVPVNIGKHEHAKRRNESYKKIQVKLQVKNKVSEMKNI